MIIDSYTRLYAGQKYQPKILILDYFRLKMGK